MTSYRSRGKTLASTLSNLPALAEGGVELRASGHTGAGRAFAGPVGVALSRRG